MKYELTLELDMNFDPHVYRCSIKKLEEALARFEKGK